MKKILSAATLLVVAISFSPLSFAADSGKAFNECKAEAEKNEVSSADAKTFVSNCMMEMDVAAADIKSLVDAEYPSSGQEESKDNKDD